MPGKTQRFTRENFPKGRPTSRRSFSWGTVSIYDTTPRYAVVVSKKALKKAHERNRARRRVYALLEELNPQKSVVVHLRREALTTATNEMKQDLARTFT